MKIYEVTRKFTGGFLSGIEHTKLTTVEFTVGEEEHRSGRGSPYIVTAVRDTGMDDACDICGKRLFTTEYARGYCEECA